MKPKNVLKSDTGAILWLGLLVLILVIIVSTAAIMLLGKKPASGTAPATVRAKIPPMPAPNLEPPPETQRPQVSEETAPLRLTQGEATKAIPMVQTNQATQPAIFPEPPSAVQDKLASTSEEPDGGTALNDTADTKAPMAADAQTLTAAVPTRQTDMPDEAAKGAVKPSQEETTVPAQQAAPADETAVDKKIQDAQTPNMQASADQTESSKAAADQAGRYTIQVGAFHSKTNAENRAKTLELLGYPAVGIEFTDKHLHPLYLVHFGHFQTLAEAATTMNVFMEKEKMSAVVSRATSP